MPCAKTYVWWWVGRTPNEALKNPSEALTPHPVCLLRLVCLPRLALSLGPLAGGDLFETRSLAEVPRIDGYEVRTAMTRHE